MLKAFPSMIHESESCLPSEAEHFPRPKNQLFLRWGIWRRRFSPQRRPNKRLLLLRSFCPISRLSLHPMKILFSFCCFPPVINIFWDSLHIVAGNYYCTTLCRFCQVNYVIFYMILFSYF